MDTDRQARQLWRITALLLLFALALAGCGSSKVDWDPSAVEATLTTEPAVVRAGEEITLFAELSGVPDVEGSDMRFDIPIDGKSNLIRGEVLGGGKYSLLFTFPRPGTYDVYIHYYLGEEHITKLKKLEVQ